MPLLRTLCLLLALLLLAPEVRAQSASYGLPEHGPDPDTLSLHDGLRLALARRLDFDAAGALMLRVAHEGTAAERPLLRQCANLYSDSYIGFNAMHALWVLGERRDYFMDLARSYAADEVLAATAVSMLARDPDSTTYAELYQLTDAADRDRLYPPVNDYEHVLKWQAMFDEASTLEARASVLMAALGSEYRFGWVSSGEAEYEEDRRSGLRPLMQWAMKRLPVLAAAHPREVEAEIAHIPAYEFDEEVFQEMTPQARARSIAGFQAFVRRIAFPRP